MLVRKNILVHKKIFGPKKYIGPKKMLLEKDSANTILVLKKFWSKKQFWSKKSKVLIKLNTSKLSLVATKHSRKLQVLLEFDTEGPSLVIVLYDWQQSLWPLYTHRPTLGLIKATCRCLKSINVDWLPNDIRRASIDRPSLTPTTHPWPDHTLPYPTSHNQIIKSLLIYLNILIFKNSTHKQTNRQTNRPTDRQTDWQTDRQNDQQTFGLIEATCRNSKMKNDLHTIPWNEFLDIGKMTEVPPQKFVEKN